MVTIVTGKINSGKTTRLKELYHSLNKGNGIVAVKEMIGSDVHGFHGHVLKSGFEFPYMIHENYKRQDSGFIDSIGPYYIYKQAQYFIDNFFEIEISNRISPLFFDEVGKLEMNGGGYDLSIQLALQAKIDLYISVREDLIADVLKHYSIKEYRIVSR